MRQLLSSAWVIARRDYTSTVFSRIFILFLLTPVFPVAFGGLFGAMNSDNGPPPARVVALATDPAATRALLDARGRLAERLGDDGVPQLAPQPPSREAPDVEARRLLGGGSHAHYAALLSGSLAHPRFTMSSRAPASLTDDVALLIDNARAYAALGAAAPPSVSLGLTRIATPAEPASKDREDLAKGAQTGLFVLLVLLAGMSLSTFIEEKSNKVIEVLAAAVPVDAIFLGKLASMLAIALTFVLVWSVIVAGGLVFFAPQLLHGLPVPAVGWPMFVALLITYFVGNYLLLGAVFLGIGSQAGSPREIQVLALPVTMLQLLLYAFASTGVSHPESWVAKAAAVFPWSSPLAMLARAAEVPGLWTHALALAWQLLWLVLALRVAAAMFRRAVLKSGGGLRLWRQGAS